MNKWLLLSVFLISATTTILLFLFSEYLLHRRLLSRINSNLKPYVLIDEDKLYPTDEDDHIHDLEIHKVVPIYKNKQQFENNAQEHEALSSTHAALEMRKEGKLEKAHKLFEHAVNLAPKNPDVLNLYGEFLEESENDVMSADLLYVQALQVSPNHDRALSNRQRTAHVVEELDNKMFKMIEKKRDILSNIPETNRALIRIKKEAYFQHIYHTVGIEGNTMSLSQTRSIVETQMAVAGKSILEHNEILGLDAAMKYINSTLVKRFGPITMKDILEIHRRVLGYVDPLGSGEFRNTEVYVGGHRPPPPSDIPPRMRAFETWLNSEDAVRMHAIHYAALAHYKLVHIHPFHDGNGRTSRLLMNAILMQAGYPPVIILKQDRHRYFQALEAANEGDVRPFVRFIAECTEKTLDLFLWATHEYRSQDIPAIDGESQKSNPNLPPVVDNMLE